MVSQATKPNADFLVTELSEGRPTQGWLLTLFVRSLQAGKGKRKKRGDGSAEREAVPAELLHHQGERAAAQEGTPTEPGEPGPAHRAQAAPRQDARAQRGQRRERERERARPRPQRRRRRLSGARRPREGGAQVQEGHRQLRQRLGTAMMS
jgi:hypothetical protein